MEGRAGFNLGNDIVVRRYHRPECLVWLPTKHQANQIRQRRAYGGAASVTATHCHDSPPHPHLIAT